MTYSKLKDLSPAELLAKLSAEIKHAQTFLPLDPIATNRTPPPILCEIGDFEIRARFPDPKPCPDCGCSRPPPLHLR